MKATHKIQTQTPGKMFVQLTVTGETVDEKKLLDRLAKEKVNDDPGGEFDNFILGYTWKEFPGFSLLGGDFLEKPGEFIFELVKK